VTYCFTANPLRSLSLSQSFFCRESDWFSTKTKGVDGHVIYDEPIRDRYESADVNSRKQQVSLATESSNDFSINRRVDRTVVASVMSFRPLVSCSIDLLPLHDASMAAWMYLTELSQGFALVFAFKTAPAMRERR
jgi:hypothetical protein